MLMTYGPVGLPLFDVIAGCTTVLSDFFWPGRQLAYAVSSLAMLLAMCAFRGLLFSYIGPAVRP